MSLVLKQNLTYQLQPLVLLSLLCVPLSPAGSYLINTPCEALRNSLRTLKLNSVYVTFAESLFCAPHCGFYPIIEPWTSRMLSQQSTHLAAPQTLMSSWKNSYLHLSMWLSIPKIKSPASIAAGRDLGSQKGRSPFCLYHLLSGVCAPTTWAYTGRAVRLDSLDPWHIGISINSDPYPDFQERNLTPYFFKPCIVHICPYIWIFVSQSVLIND